MTRLAEILDQMSAVLNDLKTGDAANL
ncbi:hypothetical protein Q2358_22025, partial [Escherichia coli]|nr:hypothetical protein [Escherichia coli]